jgi:tRNA-dihydrouridine synthase A
MNFSVKTSSNTENDPRPLDRRICVAPMMDYTDRHCRFLMRLLSPHAWLYTEMITAAAISHGKAARLLAFDPSEHPVALQLGGCDPQELAEAARAGEQFGYDEINLNCGCPSDRVQSGRFGACLMSQADLVAECVAAMRAAVNVPVTVKCRIGIEPLPAGYENEERLLDDFVRTVAGAGCDIFVVHARIAVLGGLSPKENREIPPLKYDIVERVRAAHPRCRFVLNGGIKSLKQTGELLKTFDGVMLGREAYQNLYLLAELERAFCDQAFVLPAREAVVERYMPYVERRLAEGERLSVLLKPVLGLYLGQPRARSWRRFVAENSRRPDAQADVLKQAERIVLADEVATQI